MQKIYKYRSLSPFLFKELFYQELYFASCPELNDPLDLKIPVEYNVKSVKQISSLTWFLFKNTLELGDNTSGEQRINNAKYVKFVRDDAKVKAFRQAIFDQMVRLKGDQSYIYKETAEQAMRLAISEAGLDFKLNVHQLFQDIERLSNLFLANSYVSCFSTEPNSFLMWSHYAGSHQGICMEFTLPRHGKFPFEMSGQRKFNKGSLAEGFAEGEISSYVYEDSIFSVHYSDDPLSINFFDFAPVFNNEYDVDLRNLTKSHWHGYARELQRLFMIKTKNWAYEKEWRAIEVNFEGPKQPEERVRHYPIEALTGIYFGSNMPEAAKERIAKIYEEKNQRIEFYNSLLSHNRELTFEAWEMEDEY